MKLEQEEIRGNPGAQCRLLYVAYVDYLPSALVEVYKVQFWLENLHGSKGNL